MNEPCDSKPDEMNRDWETEAKEVEDYVLDVDTQADTETG
jgi:hypothetical protein